jgi:DNA-binding HxlR family transcriptional regulator
MASKLERLEKAGILERKHFSEEEQKLVESITDEEIEVLILLRKKMGAAPEGKEKIRPNIIV